MKLVKMITAILLVLAVIMAILASCSKPNDAGEISDYDSQAFIPVGGNSQPETESEPSADSGESAGGAAGGNGTISGSETQSGGFLVSEKKYDFEGNNLVVLNVENKTDKNYSIAIHMTYLDENGVTLKEETKTFEGFAAGWKNYFFFVPEIPFAKFTDTLEPTEYTGECLAQLFTPLWEIVEVDNAIVQSSPEWQENQKKWLEWMEGGQVGERPPTEVFLRAIEFNFGYEYQITRKIAVWQDVLFLSESGEVAAIELYSQRTVSSWEPWQSGMLSAEKDLYVFPDQDNPVWPEGLKGDVTVLFSFVKVGDPPIVLPPS